MIAVDVGADGVAMQMNGFVIGDGGMGIGRMRAMAVQRYALHTGKGNDQHNA